MGLKLGVVAYLRCERTSDCLKYINYSASDACACFAATRKLEIIHDVFYASYDQVVCLCQSLCNCFANTIHLYGIYLEYVVI